MKFNPQNSFTLLELLIVIGIVAVLATAVVVILNPAQLLAQARDTTRISDLSAINKSLALYQTDGKTSFGTSSTVYVSIPDSTSTCANLGLPTLPSGWNYACSSTSTFRKVNGTGWIPVDFTSISYGSTLEILPIDPINTTSTGNYYTYTPGGSWELTSFLESERRKMGGSNDKSSTDSGSFPELYETGTNLTLLPVSRDSSLVGWWRFDEGSGTTAYDASGKGNTGTLTNGPIWTTGKVSGALSFDGSNDYVNIPNGNYLNTNEFTISEWVYFNTLITIWTGGGVISKYIYNTSGLGIGMATGGNSSMINSQTIRVATNGFPGGVIGRDPSIPFNTWSHITFAFTYEGDSTYITIYRNGQNINKTLLGSGTFIPNSSPLGVGYKFTGFLTNDDYHDGYIDDVRIYNRALSAAEIAALYNSAK